MLADLETVTFVHTLQADPAGCGSIRDEVSAKTKVPGRVKPGSLSLNLGASFDWYDRLAEERHMWFGESEMGGERNVLFVPCVLAHLSNQPTFLWSTTDAATDRGTPAPSPWVVEVICEAGLRDTDNLVEGHSVLVESSELAPAFERGHLRRRLRKRLHQGIAQEVPDSPDGTSSD